MGIAVCGPETNVINGLRAVGGLKQPRSHPCATNDESWLAKQQASAKSANSVRWRPRRLMESTREKTFSRTMSSSWRSTFTWPKVKVKVQVPIVSITLSQLCDLRVGAHLRLAGLEPAVSADTAQLGGRPHLSHILPLPSRRLGRYHSTWPAQPNLPSPPMSISVMSWAFNSAEIQSRDARRLIGIAYSTCFHQPSLS